METVPVELKKIQLLLLCIMVVYAVITFHTTHFALKAKKVLKKECKAVEMIPVPREFSSNCGFCCKTTWDDRQEIEKILRDNHVEIEQIHRWERDENTGKKKLFNFV